MERTITPAKRLVRRRASFPQRLVEWLTLARQRKVLSQLDDHLLNDIGVPRHVAAEESERPFWDVPGTWKR